MPLPKPRGRKSPYRLHFRYRTYRYRWWRLPRALSRLSPRAAIARRYIHLVQLPCAKCEQPVFFYRFVMQRSSRQGHCSTCYYELRQQRREVVR